MHPELLRPCFSHREAMLGARGQAPRIRRALVSGLLLTALVAAASSSAELTSPDGSGSAAPTQTAKPAAGISAGSQPPLVGTSRRVTRPDQGPGPSLYEGRTTQALALLHQEPQVELSRLERRAGRRRNVPRARQQDRRDLQGVSQGHVPLPDHRQNGHVRSRDRQGLFQLSLRTGHLDGLFRQELAARALRVSLRPVT